MPRSGIGGTYGGFIPIFLRNRHAIFHNCILKEHSLFSSPSSAFIACRLGGDTPSPRSGAAAERSYLASKVSGGRRKHPTSEASGSGQEELSQVRGLGRPGEATWHLRPGAVTLRSHPSPRPVSAAGRIHPCPRPGQAAGKSNPRRGGCAGTGGPRGAIPC